MLKEVDLSSLSIVDSVPVSIGELGSKSSIAIVGVSLLWGLVLAWESLGVLLVKLGHEVGGEGANSGWHGEQVDREQVLQGDGHEEDEHPLETLVHLVLVCCN